MGFLDIFRAYNRKRTWKRLPDDHVLEDDRGSTTFRRETIVVDEDYAVLRLSEMWLSVSRRLWRKYYPMLHAYVEYGSRKEHDVVGPAQLRELGERNLERLQSFNHRLVGPLPATGHELRALVGLYAIPGSDAAKALVDVVGSVAGLAGPAGATAAEVTELVKTSVDKVVGLADATLQIGVENTWGASKVLESGHYVAIDAEEVRLEELWLTPERRLAAGVDPIVAKPYSGDDYMVLSIERHVHNPAWASIEAVGRAEAALEQIMGAELPDGERRRQLAAKWPAFESALRQAKELTRKDAIAIAAEVKSKLRERLEASVQFGLERQAFAGRPTEGTSAFDAAEETIRRGGAFGAETSEIEARLAAIGFER